MRTNLTQPIEYPTEFIVEVKVEEGSRELVAKHLDNLPGKEVVAVSGKQPQTFYVLLEADDKNHALWRVRHHLQPVCGVLSVS